MVKLLNQKEHNVTGRRNHNPRASIRCAWAIIGKVSALHNDSQLFGAIPELDSLAVGGLLTEVEDRLDITIDDDEVDGELFATFGNLVRFAETKVAE